MFTVIVVQIERKNENGDITGGGAEAAEDRRVIKLEPAPR